VPPQPQRNDLTELAEQANYSKSRRVGDIYLAVSTLFEHQDGTFSAQERSLATDILRRLGKDVEMSIRIALAGRLAESASAPHELILLLADDRIEVARPILARSPVLTEDDLVHVVRIGTRDHQLTIAERPEIGVTVTAALARSACEAAIIALLRNRSAQIGEDTFAELADRARNSETLQEPLILREDLPPVLVSRLYVWVGGALKTALLQRHPHLSRPLAAALDRTNSSLQAGKHEISESSAQRLVVKLAASGQLGPSFLIRVLTQGQTELFDHGFATLLGVPVTSVRHALYSGRPAMIALACRAVGIDRAVFQTVHDLCRRIGQRAPQLNETDRVEVENVFAAVLKSEAAIRFKAIAA
jgi:uncharacterized protein (DUF2336 family)